MPPELDPLVDLLCRDVGYHGRMLEAIATLLAPGSDLRVQVDAHCDEPYQCLPQIHQALFEHQLSKEFFSHIITGPDVLIYAVCVSLLGRTIGRNVKISPNDAQSARKLAPSSSWTFDDLQSFGVFIGDNGNAQGEITPSVTWVARCQLYLLHV